MKMSCFGSNTVWFCHVLLLDESEHPVEIRKKTNGEEVLEKVFKHLNVLEKDYFGLRYIDRDSQSRWLDPLKPVVKQLTAGPPYLLYFCVKFYAADPCRLHEEVTRYLFFLQVKKDIYQGRLPCATNILAELSAYSIQSELGEYDPREHTMGYVSEFRFIPNQSEELEKKIFHQHKKLGPMVPSVAEFMYLDKVKWLEMYGVDLHPVKGEDFVEYFVALRPSGVAVYKNKTRVGSYLWSKIERVDFKGKKFYLSVKGKEDREYTFKFYLPTKTACKHLWKCCLEHHVFFRLDKSAATPNRKNSGLFRTSSSYRYSGRTQKEALEEGKKIQRPDPEVKRKPSKRYERRTSSVQSVEKALSTVTVGTATSVSQVQIKRFSQQENSTEVITVPVNGNNGSVVKTEGDPSSKDGNTTTDGPALPWEQSAQMQGGLYTPAPDSPRSLKSSGSGRAKRSPKFPRPHRRSAAQSSGSETDTPRRRSRRAYSSDDDTGRRRRKRCRHHHRGHHSAESGSDRDSSYSREERRHHRSSREHVDFSKMSDSAPYHWSDSGGRRDRGSGSEDRSHHHHHRHRHREGDARSDGSASRHRHSKTVSDADPDSEMVPALDVIHSRVAVARVKDGSAGRHRHHRHHRHSYLSNQSSESGYSAMSAPAPKSSQVLLELGPETAPLPKQGPGSKQTGHVMNTSNSHSSPTRPPLGYEQQGLFSSRLGSSPREGSPDKTGQYLKLEYPNGVIIHDTRNQGRIPSHVMYQAALELNGTTRHHYSPGRNTTTDYIEVVSGPTRKGDPPPYYYSSPQAISPASKSTVL